MIKAAERAPPTHLGAEEPTGGQLSSVEPEGEGEDRAAGGAGGAGAGARKGGGAGAVGGEGEADGLSRSSLSRSSSAPTACEAEYDADRDCSSLNASLNASGASIVLPLRAPPPPPPQQQQRRPPQPARSSSSRSSRPGAAAGSLTFEQAMAPRPYLVVACSYPGAAFALSGAVREARLLEAGPRLTARLDNPSVYALRARLGACEGIHLVCHGDAPLHGEKVPLLVNPEARGGVEALSISAWVALLEPHARAGRLCHAYLGGCSTLELGLALSERAGVGCVACFEGRVLDSACSMLGAEYAHRLADGADAASAWRAALASVLTHTEPGVLDNGMAGNVQKYEFCDPDHPRVHHCRCAGNARCAATGVLGSKCPWRGRLLPPEGWAPPEGWRGRLAVGVPRLLLLRQ